MKPSESSLKEAYRAALDLALKGKLDYSRLERGYELAKSGGRLAYRATNNYCNCADAVERNVTCKHQICVALLEVAKEIDSWKIKN